MARLEVLLRALLLSTVFAISSLGAAAAQPAAPTSLFELTRLRSDVYLFRYQNHVAMFITTEQGVILVDPIGQGNPRTPSILREAIRSVTEHPVRYVIYSHWGADHGTGGRVFADTAQFVSQRNAQPRIAAANDPTSPVPTITFDSRQTLELGGAVVDLYHADLSSTDDYLILHYPAGRLVMFVDLVQPMNLPFRTFLGDPDRIVQRFEWIDQNLDFDVIVSGHASPRLTATREELRGLRQYYFDLAGAIAGARAAGHPDNSAAMLAAVRTELAPRYGEWRNFETYLPLNVEGMIRWRATR